MNIFWTIEIHHTEVQPTTNSNSSYIDDIYDIDIPNEASLMINNLTKVLLLEDLEIFSKQEQNKFIQNTNEK